MSRYFEYIYLIVAIGLVAFLAFNYKDLGTGPFIAILVGTLLSSFMYSFRKKQRQVMEAEEARQMQEEEGEDGA